MQDKNYNPIIDADSYKASHWVQYPPKTEYVYSYIESRGGEFDNTVMFGLQYFIKRYLTVRITKDMVDEAEAVITTHGEPFNKEGWMYIVNELDGRIPLEIKAVPEGSVIPVSNVLATVVNTDPKCYWVTSYFETAILRAIWYPTTVATVSRECKNLIAKGMDISSDSREGLEFKLHDFGARGVSSYESAGIGGAAHLINFMGTDTMSALTTIMRYYNADSVPGFSIPATEHSCMSSWGKDSEVDAYRNMLNQYKGDYPLIAVVSDTWDIYKAASDIWGGELKQEVIDSGSMVVVRPDSGNPSEVVVKVLNLLGEKFGYEVNSKGFKVLNNVRVIQGDGITVESIPQIIMSIMNSKWSIDNVAFGMGGGLLQMVNRDTQKFAMKCSAIMIDGVWNEVYKDPITDKGKVSKRGTLSLIKNNNKFETVNTLKETPSAPDMLETVFVNGELVKDVSFEEVRSNSV